MQLAAAAAVKISRYVGEREAAADDDVGIDLVERGPHPRIEMKGLVDAWDGYVHAWQQPGREAVLRNFPQAIVMSAGHQQDGHPSPARQRLEQADAVRSENVG